jgi:hypothetical protein
LRCGLPQLRFERGFDADLLKRRWAIVVGEAKNAIVNALPLSLIFRLEPLVAWLMRSIAECCEADEAPALEANEGGLLSCVFEGCRLDEKFEAASSLFCVLGGRTMKGKGLQSLFRLLASLPGGFRPAYTLDILKLLMFVFQNPFDSPSSMFALSASSFLNPIKLSQIDVSSFTFFFDISLADKAASGDLFFMEMENGTTLRLVMSMGALFFQLKTA